MDIIPLHHSSQCGYGCLCEDSRGSAKTDALEWRSRWSSASKVRWERKMQFCPSATIRTWLHQATRILEVPTDSGQLSCAASVPILARAHSHRLNAYAISAVRQDRGATCTEDMVWNIDHSRAVLTVSRGSLGIMTFIVKFKGWILWRISS